MARSRRIRGFQIKSERVEKEKLQIDKERLKSSNDFNQITLAISLLAGTWFFLSKLIDYLNNSLLTQNNYLQSIVYFVLIFLLIELLITFFFILIKGYLISGKNGNEWLNKIAQLLLKNSFKYSIFFSVLMISKLFLDFILKNQRENFFLSSFQYDFIISLIIIIFFCLIFSDYIKILISYMYLYFKKIMGINEKVPESKNIEMFLAQKLLQLKQYELTSRFLTYSSKILKTLIFRSFLRKIDLNKISRFYLNIYFILTGVLVLSFVFLFIINSFLMMPTYLLKDSYSVDVFPQSNINSDFITLAIKETGFPYNYIYITLDIFNSTDNHKQYVGNVTINRTKESPANNSFMFGENYEGIWYLNINTCNLQPGNYMLHAEVTNEASINNTIFGAFRKHTEKLFYIAPNSTKCFLNSTQELKNSSRSSSI
ncbi:Uncharacterised protein [uncultured archaeon]|nr:Uncharacterised protein [uncultured archaeon]